MIRFVLGSLLLVALVLQAALTQENVCAGVRNGKTVRLTCSGYVNCTNQTPDVVTCEAGKVVERDTLTCIPVDASRTACGTQGDCNGTGYQAARNCQSFFYCQNGRYHANSHIYCPGDLLFDGVVCNYPQNVTCLGV